MTREPDHTDDTSSVDALRARVANALDLPLYWVADLNVLRLLSQHYEGVAHLENLSPTSPDWIALITTHAARLAREIAHTARHGDQSDFAHIRHEALNIMAVTLKLADLAHASFEEDDPGAQPSMGCSGADGGNSFQDEPPF